MAGISVKHTLKMCVADFFLYSILKYYFIAANFIIIPLGIGHSSVLKKNKKHKPGQFTLTSGSKFG